MQTFFLTSSNGLRIIYDVVGSGPTIILLHGGGGGQSYQSWHQTGYVDRLKREYRVITPDIRGHSESDKLLVGEFEEIDLVFPIMKGFTKD